MYLTFVEIGTLAHSFCLAADAATISSNSSLVDCGHSATNSLVAGQ